MTVSASVVPVGVYAFVFGVDAQMDGVITWESLAWDAVWITLTDLSNISIGQVPIEIYRRAAQLLEEMRGSPMAPAWESAQLGQEVRPFYRPDIDGIAYYEFSVEPSGFIMVSSGDHDHPIPHWSDTGPSIGAQLVENAQQAGKEAVTFHKLDTLFYAAEDGAGELAATVGNTLLRIIGMDRDWLNYEEIPLTQIIAQPQVKTEDDEHPSDVTYEVELTGPESSPVEFEAWESWPALKEGYGETYQVLAEALRRDAQEDWETESLVREFGEGLFPGETHRLVLLYPRAQWELNGPGAQLVQVTLIDRQGLPDLLEISATDSPPDGAAELNFLITYPNDRSETFRFVILDPGLQDSIEEKTSPDSARSQALSARSSPWSEWTIYWAGTKADQRLYHQYQMPMCVGPWCGNCASGCGATAWAMLFGWADHQAWIGNASWVKGNGLYLQNGGKWPSPDADAPQTENQGIENITKEIRTYIGSWCFPFTAQSATLPWTMHNAYKYFVGRTGTGLKTDYSS